MNASHNSARSGLQHFIQVMLLIGLLVLAGESQASLEKATAEDIGAAGLSGNGDSKKSEEDQLKSDLFGGNDVSPENLDVEAITAENAVQAVDLLNQEVIPGLKATATDPNVSDKERGEALQKLRTLQGRIAAQLPSEPGERSREQTAAIRTVNNALRSGNQFVRSERAKAADTSPAPSSNGGENTDAPAPYASPASTASASTDNGTGNPNVNGDDGGRQVNEGGNNLNPPGTAAENENEDGAPGEEGEEGQGGEKQAGAGGAGEENEEEEQEEQQQVAQAGGSGGGQGSSGAEGGKEEGGGGGDSAGGSGISTAAVENAEGLEEAGKGPEAVFVSESASRAMLGSVGASPFSVNLGDDVYASGYLATINGFGDPRGRGAINPRTNASRGSYQADLDAANEYVSQTGYGVKQSAQQKLLDLAKENKKRVYGVLGPANLAAGSTANRRFLNAKGASGDPRSIQEIYGNAYLDQKGGSAAASYGQGHKY